MEIIAKLKLAPGEIGYFDEVSNTHLTQRNPIKQVTAGTNCSVLRRSVKCGRLILLTGSLGKPRTLKEILSVTKKGVTIKPVIPANDARPTATIDVDSNINAEQEALYAQKAAEEVAKAEQEAAAAKLAEAEAAKLAEEQAAEKAAAEAAEKTKTEVEPKVITSTPGSIRSLKVGDTRTLSVDVEKAVFKSADESIATVDENGVVSGIAAGQTVVVITAKDSVETTVSVTVVGVEAK